MSEKKKFVFTEQIEDLWCPFCGHQLYNNKLERLNGHFITKIPKTINIVCTENGSKMGNIRIEIMETHTTLLTEL